MSGANGNGAHGHGGSVDLAVAIVDSLDDAGLELLAERLRPWLPEQAPADAGGWLNPARAANGPSGPGSPPTRPTGHRATR